MKKLEEINTLLKKLEELTGNADFENAENLGNEEYSEYCKIRNSLIGTIVQVVKAEKKAFDYAEVENTFGNQEFWEQIKESVERDTDIFLKMEILRKLDLKSRKKHYLEIFSEKILLLHMEQILLLDILYILFLLICLQHLSYVSPN